MVFSPLRPLRPPPSLPLLEKRFNSLRTPLSQVYSLKSNPPLSLVDVPPITIVSVESREQKDGERETRDNIRRKRTIVFVQPSTQTKKL